MTGTTKEKLARAEFWAMEAMNCYDNGEQRDILRQAYDLIKKAGENEEQTAYNQALRAAQII